MPISLIGRITVNSIDFLDKILGADTDTVMIVYFSIGFFYYIYILPNEQLGGVVLRKLGTSVLENFGIVIDVESTVRSP